MRTSAGQRFIGLLAVAALAGALLLPAAALPARAADKLVLRVGTTQDLDTTNPYQTILTTGYEVFELTYNLLVDFGPNLEPIPGFADKWQRAADGKSWTFHIREGMKWSDGTPATAQDACYSWGLGTAAAAAGKNVGAAYLDPGLTKDAGVTKVECPDDQTLIAYTTDPSDRILQVYMPIIPKHIWGKYDYKGIGDAKFTAPLVGTGPYLLTEWKPSQYARFVRNPNYWGTPQGAADEVIISFYKTADTMVQALKAGELDYAHGVNPDQLKALQGAPNIKTVVGASNGWTQLAFNEYGATAGQKLSPGVGPSTQALWDPVFRDALGYATDKKILVEKVLGGFGDVGTTAVPPVLVQWHVEPDHPRTFDIALAKQKLDAAGYVLNSQGQRLDKQGKPISLRLDYPNTRESFAKTAQFVKDWYGQLGIKVTATVYDTTTLGNIVLPPEAGKDYKANYDIELWDWVGVPDPNGLLINFRCDAIGNASDSQYCNPEFDKLYDSETGALTSAERKTTLATMQNMLYDQAVYDILFYDSTLSAYRTDKFGGWQNQPANGTPFMSYGTIDYTLLTAISAATPSPAPSASASAGASTSPGASAAPTPAPTPAPGGGTGGNSTGTYLAIIVAVVVVAGVIAAVVYRRRQAGGGGAEEE
jgi:peptide/nickel transport system substrate-binding protein